ncbi:MAG: thioredoxin [archaeon]
MLQLNKANFEKEVIKSGTPVIIDFWAAWCGPCQMMGPVFEELSKEYIGKLKFVKLNTEESPEIAANFSIHGIPCLVITKNGKEVDRIMGFAPKESLKEKIDEILERI